MKPESLAKIV